MNVPQKFIPHALCRYSCNVLQQTITRHRIVLSYIESIALHVSADMPERPCRRIENRTRT